MSTVTIAFTPRERFSLAAEALERLYACTRIPFNLIVVDCNIPPVYRRQMDEILRGRDNVKIIRQDGYLLPNQSKNLVISQAEDEYLAIVENDVLVKDGWLSTLIQACEEHPADVAVPLIIEGPLNSRDVHFDDLLGQVRCVEGPNGTQWEILPRKQSRQHDRGSERRTVQFMEQHCLLFRRSVFDRIGLYDEELNTRDEVDLSLSLYNAGIPVVFEPKCEVHYIPPFPPNRDELPYFFKKWDLERAANSRQRIEKRWNLVKLPGDMNFVRYRNLTGQLYETVDELRSLVSSEKFILVDEGQLGGSDIVDGLQPIPFLEKDGQYWGAPVDDSTAIRELNRLRNGGASHIAFCWSCFWWFEHYSEFYRYLCSTFNCVLKNDRLVAFDLARKPTSTRVETSKAAS